MSRLILGNQEQSRGRVSHHADVLLVVDSKVLGQQEADDAHDGHGEEESDDALAEEVPRGAVAGGQKLVSLSRSKHHTL